MGQDRQRLYSWAVPDAGQPLTEMDRAIIDDAFELMEELLRGRIVLIVAKMELDGYSFMEPRQSDVDFDRVVERLYDAISYMEERG